MCFRQLPIDFDEQGQAFLTGDWDTAKPPQWMGAPVDPIPAGPGVHTLAVQPVTRIAGSMDFHATIDLRNRRVLDARASAAAFRGYEIVLRKRDPREAMDLSSRACGVCGGVHASTASMALDMALPVSPPPLGILTRNIAQAAEFLYDHSLHLCLLAGPDYAASVVRRTDPELWRRATAVRAPGEHVHGFATIGNIMEALEPFEGSLYMETFARTRVALHIVQTMVGKYPHPATLVPGGVSVLLDDAKLLSVREDLGRLVDYVKRLIHVYDDLMAFFRTERPLYEEVGRSPINLISFGRYDDVEKYDGQFATLDTWASARSVPPGVIIGGEVRTTSLRRINLGIEEFVDHAYYERWSGTAVETDPGGAPISPFHPWNKETVAKPEGRNWQEKYTWSTAPRWDREVVEAGPIARNWMIAVAGRPWDSVLEPSSNGFRFVLPAGDSLPEMTFQWKLPGVLNAVERNLARVYSLGPTWLQAATDVERGLRLLATGERKVWNRSSVPDYGIGAGFWEAARGALGHWTEIEGKVIKNYQIVTPSTFNASPRDPWGNPGPYEQAVMATPIVEEFRSEEDFTGVDIMRVIRSFDPCMPCAVHMFTGRNTLSRDVISCACGEDG